VPLFVNAEKLPYGGRFGVIEQNRPYQTSDLLQKNETHFPRCVGPKQASHRIQSGMIRIHSLANIKQKMRSQKTFVIACFTKSNNQATFVSSILFHAVKAPNQQPSWTPCLFVCLEELSKQPSPPFYQLLFWPLLKLQSIDHKEIKKLSC